MHKYKDINSLLDTVKHVLDVRSGATRENMRNLVEHFDMTVNDVIKILEFIPVNALAKLSVEKGEIISDSDIQSLFDYLFGDNSDECVDMSLEFTDVQMRLHIGRIGLLIPAERGGIYFIYHSAYSAFKQSFACSHCYNTSKLYEAINMIKLYELLEEEGFLVSKIGDSIDVHCDKCGAKMSYVSVGR